MPLEVPASPAPEQTPPTGSTDAVVIGRNEGARLLACLQSLQGQVGRIVYVDSGSIDGSVAAAKAAGAVVVELDPAVPFTAARARNEGFARLMALDPPPDFVQFVDGDCSVDPDWVATARRFLDAHPRAVVVCGRRRERHPEVSIFNRFCDREWNTPVGPALACGGDALMRAAALAAVGGYRVDLIAGEEPELCLRLRRQGGEVWRIDAEMTLHDANITRIGQWWRRSVRAGHAFAEGAALHGAAAERHWVAETRRALLWGAGVPLAALTVGLVHPAGMLILLLWPIQMLRLAWRWRAEGRAGWEAAVLTVLGKPAEAIGVVTYHLNRMRRRRAGLIEYR